MESTAPAKTTAQSWGQGPAHTTNKQTNWGHAASGSRVCERQPTMAGVDIMGMGDQNKQANRAKHTHIPKERGED